MKHFNNIYEIEKGFKVVCLDNKKFMDDDGNIITYGKNSYGFKKNGVYVSAVCRTCGGSSLPLSYDYRTAHLIEESGFFKSEIAYCKEIK